MIVNLSITFLYYMSDAQQSQLYQISSAVPAFEFFFKKKDRHYKSRSSSLYAFIYLFYFLSSINWASI